MGGQETIITQQPRPGDFEFVLVLTWALVCFEMMRLAGGSFPFPGTIYSREALHPVGIRPRLQRKHKTSSTEVVNEISRQQVKNLPCLPSPTKPHKPPNEVIGPWLLAAELILIRT